MLLAEAAATSVAPGSGHPAQLPSGETRIFPSLMKSWQEWFFFFFFLITRAKYFTTERSENAKDKQVLETNTKNEQRIRRADTRLAWSPREACSLPWGRRAAEPL